MNEWMNEILEKENSFYLFSIEFTFLFLNMDKNKN